MSTQEHMDVSVTQRQTLSMPLILQSIAMLGALAGIYANTVANDRELTAKLVAQQERISTLELDSRAFKSDLRSDLKEIKDELRQLRDEVKSGQRK